MSPTPPHNEDYLESHSPRGKCQQTNTVTPSRFQDENSYLLARFRARRQQLLQRRCQYQQQQLQQQQQQQSCAQSTPSRFSSPIRNLSPARTPSPGCLLRRSSPACPNRQDDEQRHSSPKRANSSPSELEPPWPENYQSPLKQFDNAVTQILRKRLSEGTGEKIWQSKTTRDAQGQEQSQTRVGSPELYAASSCLTMEREMEGRQTPFEPGFHLREAADRLAIATYACRYQGAVHAAEQAAKTATTPREAEEAAAAGARGYTTKIEQEFNENIEASGLYQPVQVIGYIGITSLTD